MAQKQSPAGEEMTEVFEDVLGILQDASIPEKGDPDASIDDVVDQMEANLTKINEQAEELYKSTGMSKDELEAFAEDPDNFTEEEWYVLNQIRDEVKRFQERASRMIEEGLPSAEDMPEKPKKPKKATGKKKRPRKKDWMAT